MSPEATRRGRILAACLLIATLGLGAALAWPGAAAPGAPLAGKAAATTGGVTLATQIDRTRVLQGGDGLVRVEVTLAAAASAEAAPIVPSDIVVVLDQSGSMAGQRFVDAVAAVRALIGRLRPEDRFALVSYHSIAWPQIMLEHADAAHIAGWLAQLDRLTTGGGTNISAALGVAHALVGARREGGRPVRMLLISDGEPTEGDTSNEGLLALARRANAAEYVLGAVGVGLNFNEFLMAGLADAGAGNFYSLHDQNSLDGIFAAEFDAARATIARGVAVQFRTAPGVQVIDAAGYPIEHADGIATFRPGDLAAGQTRRVFVTLRVPTHMPAERALGDVALNFISDGVQRSTPIAALPAVACVADEATFTAGLDKATWERSVVEGAYANIEKQVAAQVRAGDAAGARALLAGYRARTETLNSAVGSVAVADHLGRLGAIEAQIDDAFTGADQSKKQNVFSKSLNRSGWLHSRAGVSY